MKINGPDPFGRLKSMNDRLSEAERVDRGAARGAREAAGSDEVNLSERVREMRQLRGVLESSPAVREELVESLRSEIASGRYRIDGTRIADEMLKEASSLDHDA